MIFFPQKYMYKKDTSVFEGGVRSFSNAMVVGERAVILDGARKEFFYTKGSEYQIKATIARRLYHGKRLNQNAICFPGFNHSNWYHVVADMGFQIFLAKQRGLIDSIILPVAVKSYGQSFVQFFKLFDLEIHFVEHPRKIQKLKGVICFDKVSGRLSEAMVHGELDEELKLYFEFLRQSFVNSDYLVDAKKYGEKIFSTRRGKDSRVYEKVAEVESEYLAKGYQVIHFGGMNVFEQMAVMHNTTHLSGFHGANLTNLIFAHQCQHVEELITRELSGDFHTIAVYRGMSHSRFELN